MKRLARLAFPFLLLVSVPALAQVQTKGVQYDPQSVPPFAAGKPGSYVKSSDGVLYFRNSLNADSALLTAGTGVPSARTVGTTAPLGGGGALSSNLTLTCTTCALTTTTISAGAGLTGGGTLAADRSIAMPNTGPGAGTIAGGSAYVNSITLDAQGRVTAATAATPAGGVPTSRSIATTSPLGGGGTLASDLTLTCTTCVVNTGSYADPSWITSLAGSKITGTVPAASGVTLAATLGTLNLAINTQTATSLNWLRFLPANSLIPGWYAQSATFTGNNCNDGRPNFVTRFGPNVGPGGSAVTTGTLNGVLSLEMEGCFENQMELHLAYTDPAATRQTRLLSFEGGLVAPYSTQLNIYADQLTLGIGKDKNDRAILLGNSVATSAFSPNTFQRLVLNDTSAQLQAGSTSSPVAYINLLPNGDTSLKGVRGFMGTAGANVFKWTASSAEQLSPDGQTELYVDNNGFQLLSGGTLNLRGYPTYNETRVPLQPNADSSYSIGAANARFLVDYVGGAVGSQPVCASGTRGGLMNIFATSGNADSFQVCAKSAADSYAWISGVTSARTISTTAPLGGGGALSADLTLTCTTCLTNASGTLGDLFYRASTGTALSAIADVTTGSYLLSGGVGAAPLWSTLKLPNTAAIGTILAATSADTIGVISPVAGGQVLTSAGAAALPTWSATPSATSFTASVANAAVITPGHFSNSSTVATVGAQKWGLAFESTGSGWKTTATAAAQAVAGGWYMKPVQGTTAPTYLFSFYERINAGTRTDRLAIGNIAGIGYGLLDATGVSGFMPTTSGALIGCSGCTNYVAWISNELQPSGSLSSTLGDSTHVWTNEYLGILEARSTGTPTCAVGAGGGLGAGSPTCTVTGSNMAGYVTLVTGTTPTGNSGTPPVIFTFTNSTQAYAVQPICAVLPGNVTAATTGTTTSPYFDPTAGSTTTWVEKQANATGLTGGGATYIWTYNCTGRP